jgi:rare lipoprotein A
MKKQHLLILFCSIVLVACGGRTVKPTPPVAANKPPTQAPSTTTTKPGGYYLDDGPGDNPPQDIDSIPNAIPKKEPLLERANKPYKALGATYTPMTSYQPYQERGTASWYGKRYHGKNTSSGEVYDMYSMSAAHPILPLPSYVKVTNSANGRWVIVRVNDRGPFKSSRIIDLSYAAAYKLRFSAQGSSLVEVEAIDPNNIPSYALQEAPINVPEATSILEAPTPATPPAATPVATTKSINPPIQNSNPNPAISQFFVQVGAFKSEANADLLVKKIQGLELAPDAGVNNVYNGGLYRLKLGPFDNKQEADQAASSIRKRLNIPTIIINQ